MNEDNEKIQKYVEPEVHITEPLFVPLAGEEVEKDWFLTQFAAALIYAANETGDRRNEWFNRIVGYERTPPGAPAIEYKFMLNGTSFTMEQVLAKVKNKSLTIRITNVTNLSYSPVINYVCEAKMTADVEVTLDGRLTPYTQIPIVHKIKATFEAFDTKIGA